MEKKIVKGSFDIDINLSWKINIKGCARTTKRPGWVMFAIVAIAVVLAFVSKNIFSEELKELLEWFFSWLSLLDCIYRSP